MKSFSTMSVLKGLRAMNIGKFGRLQSIAGASGVVGNSQAAGFQEAFGVAMLCLALTLPLAPGAAGGAEAGLSIDEKALGTSLGGWTKADGSAAEYPLSGSTYRTYKPEVSPTPEGGLFVSVRIDHVRGWLSSDDHAMLEITVGPLGIVSSAKSSIAIQGRSIASDVILGTNEAGKQITGAERAVQIGTDLVSDLTARLLRENLVEAGRVSFPAAIRHNYNHLYRALRLDGQAVPPLAPVLAPVARSGTSTSPIQGGTASGSAPTASPATPPQAPPTGSSTSSTPPLPNPATPGAAMPGTTSPSGGAGGTGAASSGTASEPPPPVAIPVPGNAVLEISPFETPAGGALPSE